MKLFADSGSTKTSWILKADKNIIQDFETIGMNPFFVSEDDIMHALETHLRADTVPHIKEVHFFGAGCSAAEKAEWLSSVFSDIFENAEINIQTDIEGAVKAVSMEGEKSIISILGTGSAFRVFDGNNLVKRYSSLGFIIGDEGSGTHISKALLRKLFYLQLNPILSQSFFDFYRITSVEIMENVYSSPMPNRYLAQFTKFCSHHIHQEEIEKLVLESFDDFFKNHIISIENYTSYRLHFVGSIAYFFKNQLKKTAAKYGCEIGKVIQKPLNNIVLFS